MISVLLAAVALTGVSTRPNDGCYAIGERAEVTFSASELSASSPNVLAWRVDDAFGKTLLSKSEKVLPDAAGKWSGRFDVPCDRYGFYRVYAELDGVKLPRCGTRGEGYFTYVVLPDPEKRPYLEPEDAFTGLHGTAEGQCRWLGTRWDLQRWPLGTDEDFKKFMAERQASSWKKHAFITASRIFQRPGCFSEEGRAWIRANCKHPFQYECYWDLVASPVGRKYLAEAFRNLARRACHEEDFGQKMHVYEIFWEPELHYPNREALLTAAKIAWDNIRAEDKDALIAGPTQYAVGFVDELRTLFEKGLGEHLNAFAIHPYGMPSEGKNLPILRETMQLVREYLGPDVKFFATEANIGAAADPVSERRQLDLLVRTLLVMKGEGFAFHHVFYGYDYGGDRMEVPSGGCGLAYNIEWPTNRWNAKFMSPKPSFAGISGFSWLLDGAKPVVALDRFKDSRLGYVYEDKSGHCTIALWDWGGKESEVKIETGCENTRMADVFGNVSSVASPGGKLTVKLSSTPVYLVGVNPSLWSKNGTLTKRLKALPREVKDPVRLKSAVATFSETSPGVTIALKNEGDMPQEGRLTTRIRGVPEARQAKAIALPAHGGATAHFDFAGYEPSPFQRPEIEVDFESASVRAQRKFSLGYFCADRKSDGKKYPWAGGVFSAVWDEKELSFDLTTPDPKLRMCFAKTFIEKRTDNGFADLVNVSPAEFVFAKTESGVSAERTATKFKDKLPLGPFPAHVSISPEGSGWRYRISIGWEQLNVTDPHPGMSVRLAFASGGKNLFEPDGGIRNYGELLLK